MGFLDALLGKSRLPKPKADKMFAMSTAYVTLNSNLGLNSQGAGICFKPLEASRFASAEIELRELLQQRCKETNTQYIIKKDSFGYTWVILNDPEFEDLVTTVYMVSETLKENDFGEQLLCAVFKFREESDVFWIYIISSRQRFTLLRLCRIKKGTPLTSSGFAQLWRRSCP